MIRTVPFRPTRAVLTWTRHVWLILGVGVVVASATALLLTRDWFDSGPQCDDGFDKADWELHPKDTG